MAQRWFVHPRRAAREWFANAGVGLFLHWGLYSKYGENCPYLYENDDVSTPEYGATMDEFAHEQIRELLTDYGPIAAVWLGPTSSYYQRPDLFPVRETPGDTWTKRIEWTPTRDSNVLLNTAPRFDGSIQPASERVLREVGERIRTDGRPTEQRPLIRLPAPRSWTGFGPGQNPAPIPPDGLPEGAAPVHHSYYDGRE